MRTSETEKTEADLQIAGHALNDESVKGTKTAARLSATGQKSRKRYFRDIALFAMFGSMMFTSKLMLAFLPNVHMLGMFTMLLTVVYRRRALIPIYVYVMLDGLFAGFNVWWIPYLYLWTLLWGVTMLLPRRMSETAATIVYPIVCSLHGLAYGALYAPAQAVMYGLSLGQTMTWIAAGFSFDIIHAIGNFAFGLFVLPLSKLLLRLDRM